MRKIIQSVLIPQKVTLLVYGMFSLLFLVFYVWSSSFRWQLVFTVTYHVIILGILMTIGFIITALLDKKFNWQIKSYFLIPIIQLLMIWIVADPIRAWQIESSKKKAKEITESLKSYKKKFGTYPKTLVELGEQLNKEIPIRTNIGTRYWYLVDGKHNYRLWFVSYYGYEAHYNMEKNNWFMAD